jgi:hypothetical protein
MTLFQIGKKAQSAQMAASNIVAHMHMHGGATIHAEQVVKCGNAMNFGWRNGQPFADVGQRTGRQPAKAVLHSMQNRQQPMTQGAGIGTAQKRYAPFPLQVALAARPCRFGRTENCIHRQAFRLGGFRPSNNNIH